MSDLKSFETKSNEVHNMSRRVLSMLSWVGNDATNKSKPMKIAKKQALSIIKIQLSATLKLESYKLAIMKKRIDCSI